jgi:septum formation protein
MSRANSARNRQAALPAVDIPVPVVLASRSPQRRELLARLVAEFEVVEPRVDEVACRAEDIERHACMLAQAKAEDVARRRPDALVIAADTLVECQGEVVGKPKDQADAIRILTLLSSHPHRVVSGLCVITPDGRRRCTACVTRVRMKKLPPADIQRYVDQEDVMGRAGAYGLEELDPNVKSLKGSASSVMGLPMEELASILQSLYPPDESSCRSKGSPG